MAISPDTCLSQERNRGNQADLRKGFFFRSKLRKKNVYQQNKMQKHRSEYLFKKIYISSNIFSLLTDAITARQ